MKLADLLGDRRIKQHVQRIDISSIDRHRALIRAPHRRPIGIKNTGRELSRFAYSPSVRITVMSTS